MSRNHTVFIDSSRMNMTTCFTALTLLICISLSPVFATVTNGNAEIGIDEKLGDYLPMDLTFQSENNEEIELRQLIKRPTIISPVYFSCRNMCPRLLGGLAEVVGKLKLDPENDYSILTISFDASDTPDVARMTKKNYVKAIGRLFPQDSWLFLTGGSASIQKFLDAIGYTIRREKFGFSHPSSLIVVSPEGKITRYLYGSTFLPFDITMAINEALEGKVGSPARRILLYCFSYDPEGKRYVFNILKVTGTAMIIFLIVFFLFLTRTPKNFRRGPR